MITVLTPVYNGEKFIESCIKVVIDQACPEVEHIIVDGGSTDQTVDIIKQYAKQYPHIRWISEKDRGQSDAMNKGIAMAQGEILSILNVDDYYEPNVLRSVSEIFKILPEPSLLVGNCKVWNHKGEMTTINKPNKLKFTELLMGWYVNTFPVNPTAYFYHTSLHQKIGLYEIDDHYTMDIDFILKSVQVATVKYVDEILGNYRMLEEAKTYQDMKKGMTGIRLDNLFRKYRKKLSKTQEIKIFIIYKISHIWHRFKMLGIRTNLKKIRDKAHSSLRGLIHIG